ncbi:MAG TPA: acyl carrier protein [Polyangiaceae bacterium]|nr:acyl carrier protein [Polyangiaceae bacterium]
MDVEKQVRDFINQTFFVEGFDSDASFLQTGIIDSSGMLELIVFVEQTLGVPILDGDLLPANLDSVDKLCAFVERKRQVAS